MKLRITLDGVTYDLDVEFLDEEGQVSTQSAPVAAPSSAVPAASARPAPAKAPSGAPAAPPAGIAGDKSVVSPLAGTVFKLLVKVGDQVKVNQELLVLEAMKMETNIVAALAGTIKNVAVAEGQAVRQGQLLVEFE